MQFTIKLRLHLKIIIGIIVIGHGLIAFYLGHEAGQKPHVSLGLVILSIILHSLEMLFLLYMLREIDNDNCKINVDSFTEGAIRDGVEERWRKIKQEISNHEFEENITKS